ncbi:MAG TPA: DNA/RNA nuclease SfsA [Holophagaceae bacterium]|nr:DNA/RNA nuclease SfsA [Holophagaceae bacterium]
MSPILTKSGLIEGCLIQRYKRFLADVELMDGSVVTAHCTNTGSMKSCWEAGDRVLLERAANLDRKLPFTWLACERPGGWVGVETGMPNRVMAEAARRDAIPGLSGLREVRTEVKYGAERSRIDVLARDAKGRQVYIEVKNTTLREGDFVLFPDAVSERGTKHLRELRAMAGEGHLAVIAFFIHRTDVSVFDAAREVDPAYAGELDRAAAAGVRVLPIRVDMQAAKQADGHWTLDWSLPGLLSWVRR